MISPTIIEQPSADVAEGVKARAWRKNIMQMTLDDLALATGYGRQHIACYEAGHTSGGKRITSRAWLRYRLACAGLHEDHQSVYRFDWGNK